jgi:hypothetical protein
MKKYKQTTFRINRYITLYPHSSLTFEYIEIIFSSRNFAKSTSKRNIDETLVNFIKEST